MPTEQMVVVVAELSRERCVDELGRVPHVPLDFTDDFLAALSTEQLRHVLLAALLQASRRHHEQRAEQSKRPAA